MAKSKNTRKRGNTQPDDELAYTISKRFPDMRDKGCSIHTDYGQFLLDANQASQVANLIERLFSNQETQHDDVCAGDLYCWLSELHGFPTVHGSTRSRSD